MSATVMEHPQKTLSPVLGRLGTLEARIAASEAEVEAALALRREVFSDNCEGLSDRDEYDASCDHLLIVETANAPDAGSAPVVATYRLIGQDRLPLDRGFYSQSEFEINRLIANNAGKRFLEFGRSCVAPEYRQKRTLELLWHGSWAYVRRHGFDVMFGCASFPGTRVEEHAEPLALLARHAAASETWHVSGCKGVGVPIAEIAPGSFDERNALRKLPPLIKGYMRLGALFSTDAVVDHAFGTTDVLVILPVSRLNPRYVAHYGAEAERYSAA